MSLRGLVIGPTQMLVESVLRRINKNLLDYFINLPESIWLSGFLDQVHLKDVMFNTRAFSNEWYSLDIPFRLKYGHIGRANIQVLFAHSKLIVEVEDMVIIVGPNLAYKSYADVIQSTMDNVASQIEQFRQIQTIRRSKDDNEDTDSSDGSKETFHYKNSEVKHISNNIEESNTTNKEGLNTLLRWLFRYVPDLSFTIRNLYIRYEDDILDSSHPVAGGIHINSVVINPARSCWDLEWPSDTNDNVIFVSHSNDFSNKSNKTTINSSNNVNSSDSPQIDASSAPQCSSKNQSSSNIDPRGIFNLKIRTCGVFWDDDSAPFIPMSLLEETEASDIKYGVFSAITTDDMQNMVNKNLSYHTWIISNLNISSQFGFVDPKNIKSPDNLKDIELNTKSKSDHLSQSSFYDSSKPHIMDNYSLPNIATILNVNIHNGLIINIYPHLVHGIVRLLTSCNQFYRWTQVRRFRPIKRPTNGVNTDDTRKICCEWWRFILQYCRYVRKEESGFNNLKDEINYRIERKRYIKTIKRWKWIELIVNGTKPISDSGRITSISSFNLGFGGVVMPNNTGNNINKTFVQFSNGTSSEIYLCEYWRYELKVLQFLAIKSEDINFILTVLQHQPYWTIAQWHILAEREFEVEFALSQNNIQNTPNSIKRSKSISDNLTLVAFGLHTQKDTVLWDLVDQLKHSLSKCILETSEFHSNINHDIRSSKFGGSSTTNTPINSPSYPGIAELNIFLLQNKEYHPYILYGENILPFEANDILIDFFGSNSQKFANNNEIFKKYEDFNIYQRSYDINSPYCKKTSWHPIRLRLHLWGRFYDEYFDAFPLSLSQTMELKQLIQFSHFLDFQQINAIAFVEYDSTFTLSASSSFDLVSLAAVASTNSDTSRTRTKLVITPAKHKVLNTNMNSSLDNVIQNHTFENYLINEDENSRQFEFEKQLTEFYKESLNFPEGLNKITEEGFQLPKILQNRLISICIPKFEINLCHLVQDNINGKSLLLDTQAQDTNKSPGLSNFLAQSRGSLSNYTQLIISFTPRKLFGIVFNSLAFKMNTFNTVRINCCLRKVDLVAWNHSDSCIFTSLVKYMSKKGKLTEKMVNENSISLISIGLDKISNFTENLEYNANNKSVLDEKNTNKIDSETLRSAVASKLQSYELSEQIDKLEISGNSQLKDSEQSTNLNDTLSPTFHPLASTPIRKVKFEEPSLSAQSTKYCDSNSLTPHETIKTSYSETIFKKMRKWNYFNLVILPPASKMDQKILSSSSRSNTTFSLRLPFYLKVDLQIMDVSIVFNDELLDCLRAEIVKLLQVYWCTQWSQYKGFGTFPISKKGKQATQISGQDGNLILCPPFKLISNPSLQGENFEWQIQRWNYLDQLLNKVHIRISIKLPRIDLAMLNNVKIAFSAPLIDLVPSFRLTIEPQIILLGTILDKFDKKYNRLYFRGFQVKFDTLQSLSNVIQLYTRIKNIIINRYNDIIQLFEVFNYEKFENISRHSLACFTKEVLRLQSQPLLDTNEILLKEFSLSVEADDINQSSPSLNVSDIEKFSYSTTNINDKDEQQYNNDCTEKAEQSQANINNFNNAGEHLTNNQTIGKSNEISSNIEKSEKNDFSALNVSNLSDIKFSSLIKDSVWNNNAKSTTKMTASISYNDSRANNLDLTLNSQSINIEKLNIYNKDHLSCIVKPMDMHPDLNFPLASQKYQVNPEVRIVETYSSKKLSNSILKGGIQSIDATCALSPTPDLKHYPGFNEINTFNTAKSGTTILSDVKNYNSEIKAHYKQLNTDVSEPFTSRNSLPLISESVLINTNTQNNIKYNTKTFHGTINSNFQSSTNNNSRNLVSSTVLTNTAYPRSSTSTTVKSYLLKSGTVLNPRKSRITLRTGLNIEKPK